jgi:hypothetical protein
MSRFLIRFAIHFFGRRATAASSGSSKPKSEKRPQVSMRNGNETKNISVTNLRFHAYTSHRRFRNKKLRIIEVVIPYTQKEGQRWCNKNGLSKYGSCGTGRAPATSRAMRLKRPACR